MPKAAPTKATSVTKQDATPSTSSTRLYIGNLHPTVDEYTLIQTFSKFGKVAKLDYLFHKSGPQRGQPRGYAFVEYSQRQEAEQAILSAHGKTIRGKRISVTYASRDTSQGSGPYRSRHDADTSQHTSLSLSKNAQRPKGTDAKIAAMEAKLAKLRENKTT